MENRSHALIAGIFTLILLTVGVIIGLWFGRDTEQRVTYTIETSGSVTGLNPQARVTYRGMVVGRVTDIGFDNKNVGQILIHVSVQKDTPVTQATWARLGQQGLTGLAFIELDDDGTSDQPLAFNTDEVRISMRVGTFEDFFQRSNQALSSLNQTLSNLNQIVDPDNLKVVHQALEDVGMTAQSLREMTQQIQPAMSQVGPILTEMQQTVKHTGDAAEQISLLASNVNHTVVQINQPGGILDQGTQTMSMLSRVSSGLATETLPRISHAATETTRAVQGIDRTVRQIQQTPQSLIFGVQTVPGPGEPGFQGFSTIVPQGVSKP